MNTKESMHCVNTALVHEMIFLVCCTFYTDLYSSKSTKILKRSWQIVANHGQKGPIVENLG